MSGDRSVSYAEGVLGVHDAYDRAKEAQADLKEAQRAVIEWADQKRQISEVIADRTADFTSDERAAHSTLSATAFEQHLKIALQHDADLKRLRSEYMVAQRNHDTAEAAIREAEFRCRTYGARMEELGGLLHFYAAVKTATRQT